MVVVAAGGDDGSCPQPAEAFPSCIDVASGPQYYAVGALLLGAGGALIGAIVAPGEKWEAVTGDRMRVAVGPAPGGGVRFVASLSF